MGTVFIEPPVLSQIYADAQQRFACVDDLAHGWEHVNRVYKLALHIAQQEGAESFIVGIAALLHDLGRTVEPSTQAHHADLSVTLADEILKTYEIPEPQQQAILHAILAHSFSRGVEPETLEARVLRDADRLDGLGAIGIMRWAITGAVRRLPQTQPYDPNDPFTERHMPNDRLYMLDHFYSKLLKLSETMMTETGRSLAQRRTAFMSIYLHEFRRELKLD